MQSTVALLEPIHDAQLESIRASRVIAMDETPIKAGQAGAGKMKAAYFWPVYGEQDEICFLYYPSRSGRHVQDALGLSPPEGAVLQTDGYAVYAQYAKKTGLTHAQCWAHSRRKVFEAQDIEPAHAEQALAWIGALYAVEAQIREENLTGPARRARRQEQARPVADRFIQWIDKQFDSNGFLLSSPFLSALAYIRERRAGLEVYLDDPDVAIDTNHLERALRVIPMGAGTGCSHGPSWAPNTSGSSRTCWPPAGCTTSIPTTTSSTSCSASASIPQRWCSNSRRGSGKSCTHPIRYAPICTAYENASQVNNAGWLPLTRYGSFAIFPSKYREIGCI
jgi:hypothetical protein